MKKKILFINSCVRGKEVSRTYELAKTFTDEFVKYNNEYFLDEIDISSLDLKSFDDEMIKERERALNGNGDKDILYLAEKFKEYDMIVVAAPYWDMMFPSVLKVYYEHIAVSGITFTYGEDGRPQGLCNAKKSVYVTTAGGYIENNNYGYDYTKGLFEFFGINETLLLKAEGLDIWGNDAQCIINEAKTEAKILAKK